MADKKVDVTDFYVGNIEAEDVETEAIKIPKQDDGRKVIDVGINGVFYCYEVGKKYDIPKNIVTLLETAGYI